LFSSSYCSLISFSLINISIIFRASTTTRPATNNPDPERDLKEIEQWLKIQGDVCIES
jgi:hypothetical protein